PAGGECDALGQVAGSDAGRGDPDRVEGTEARADDDEAEQSESSENRHGDEQLDQQQTVQRRVDLVQRLRYDDHHVCTGIDRRTDPETIATGLRLNSEEVRGL